MRLLLPEVCKKLLLCAARHGPNRWGATMGVLFRARPNGVWRMDTTDGRRLMSLQGMIDEEEVPDEKLEVIIPPDALTNAYKVKRPKVGPFAKVHLVHDYATGWCLQAGETEIKFKQQEGKFPNVDQVWNGMVERPDSVMVDAKYLGDMCSIFAGDLDKSESSKVTIIQPIGPPGTPFIMRQERDELRLDALVVPLVAAEPTPTAPKPKATEHLPPRPEEEPPTDQEEVDDAQLTDEQAAMLQFLDEAEANSDGKGVLLQQGDTVWVFYDDIARALNLEEEEFGEGTVSRFPAFMVEANLKILAENEFDVVIVPYPPTPPADDLMPADTPEHVDTPEHQTTAH